MGGTVLTAPPARSCGDPRPLASALPPLPQGQDPRPGLHPTLTLRSTQGARRGAEQPAPAGAGRPRCLGRRGLLDRALRRVLRQPQPGLWHLGCPGAVQGPHRAAGALPRAAATSAGSSGFAALLFRPAVGRGACARGPPPLAGDRACPPLPSYLQLLKPPAQEEAGHLPGLALVPTTSPRASSLLLRSG